MNFPDHPIWEFALGVYRAEGVSEACLNLQERHGVDVNVMLFCLWLGHAGRGVLADDEVKAMIEASDGWHRKVVKGLRFVRRILKDEFPRVPDDLRVALRAQVQAVEIDAEHTEQLLLAASVSPPESRAAATIGERADNGARNFGAYVRALDAKFEPKDAVDFAHILGKAFPGIAPDAALDLAEILM